MRRPGAPFVVLAFVACGARVPLGAVDGDGGSLDASPPPLDFGGDAGGSPPDAASATPGCTDKGCGDFCLPCEAGASCPPPGVFHVCSAQGECLPEQPGCITIQDLDGSPRGYVPCAGLACGADCQSCDPRSSSCQPSSGRCQRDGVCGAGAADCR